MAANSNLATPFIYTYTYIQNDFTTRELYKGLHSPWHVPRDRSAQARSSSSSSSRANRYLRVVACCTPPPSASPEFHAVMCGRQAWQKVTRQFFFLFFLDREENSFFLSSFLFFSTSFQRWNKMLTTLAYVIRDLLPSVTVP